MKDISVGDTVYMCIVVPNCDIYDVLGLTIRTAMYNWAVGVDNHNHQAFIFTENMVGEYVFKEHTLAQEAILTFRSKYEVFDDAI